MAQANINAAVDASAAWFDHDGVDMVVPGDEPSVIVVVTSVNPDTVRQHIPSQFQGFQIDFRQIDTSKFE